MNPNKALWERGDFTRIAESMRESGTALVKGLGMFAVRPQSNPKSKPPYEFGQDLGVSP